MLRRLPTAAILDGAWSLVLNIDTQLTNRAWDAPYPWGLVGQYSTRLLYGTSWTLMLGAEAVLVVLGGGGKVDWIGAATYRTEWAVPLDAPACPHAGAFGGCGVGIGGFSFLQFRPRGSRFWYEAGGGWIQQRIYNDAFRTVAESSWVLSPFAMLRELATDRERDVALRVRAGPGLYFGMHAGHMHPTLRGEELYPLSHRPLTEMYPLDAGIGPGARIEGRVTFLRHVVVEGDFVIAPFVAGGPTRVVSHDIAPLDFERQGFSVWRKGGAGVGWSDPERVPFDMTLAYFAAELSDRPVERIGYRGVMLRFDVPLRLSRED